MYAYPFLGVEIQILDLPMLEEASQSHSIVCQMCLLANDCDIVFSSLRVKFHKFLSALKSEPFLRLEGRVQV
jgi:hypothetical protein